MDASAPEPRPECGCAPYQPGAVTAPRILHRKDCDRDYSLVEYWLARQGGADHARAMVLASDPDSDWPFDH